MARPVALITPSYRSDFERFSLLCDSIDRRVTGYERHYVIADNDDMPLFQPFSSERRIVLPSSRFLPRWLRLAPPVRLRNGRKIWWSFRARPVHSWHVQQILKIAAAMEMPEQRFCFVDSDNVFVRPFDVGAYAGGERAPLYLEREAIAPDAPLHANWTRNCDRLLGHAATSFPADDYIGNVIVWDKDAVRDMAQTIERTTRLSWPLALCRTRAFSEYLLYGHFVQNSPERRAEHETTTHSLAISYWGEAPLDAATVADMIANATKSKVALSVQSFSYTSEAMIREAAGCPRKQRAAARRASCMRRNRNAVRLLVAAFIVATLAWPAGPAPARERLIHAEDFSTASTFDPSFWIAETGFFRNKEAQYYRPANVSVKGGALTLEGRRETVLNAAYDANGADWLTTTKSADYTSGSIVSRDAFTYGVFEVVARLPQGAGAWPAVWMVYEQGLPYREIDLVEAVGNTPGKVWSTIDAGQDLKSLKTWQAETPMPGLANAFHAYRLEWRKDAIALAIDGREVLRMNPEEVHKDGIDPLRAPMHLRINLALGGSWGGKIDEAALPARVEVKSIKIWSVEP